MWTRRSSNRRQQVLECRLFGAESRLSFVGCGSSPDLRFQMHVLTPGTEQSELLYVRSSPLLLLHRVTRSKSLERGLAASYLVRSSKRDERRTKNRVRRTSC